MITRHISDRRPAGRNTAWTRKVEMDGSLVTYRLFRRDMRGKLHQSMLQYLTKNAKRSMIASDLRRVKKLLRGKIDEIDIAVLGL